ncbi:MAG: FkbM family methyltransferase [Terriglobales bacterium]
MQNAGTAALKGSLRRLAWAGICRLPKRELVILTENGRFAVSNKDRVIGKKLFVDRSYELAEIDLFVSFLKRGGWLAERPIVADVGANLGMISIAMLLRGHFREAVAFEPFPETMQRLLGNIERNGLQDRVRAWPLAMSSQRGSATLSLSPDNSGDHRIEESSPKAGEFHEERRRRVAVETASFDEWMAETGYDPRRIGLIWLDVQGYEGQFLAGARRSLEARIPVVTEIWPYALERTGLGCAGFLRLVGALFPFFHDGSQDRQEPEPIARLAEVVAGLRSKREMTQVALIPRGR